MAKFVTTDWCMLIFCYFFPLLMQLQLQQRDLHMSALLVICYTKGHVLLGRCANLKKKNWTRRKIFFSVHHTDVFHLRTRSIQGTPTLTDSFGFFQSHLKVIIPLFVRPTMLSLSVRPTMLSLSVCPTMFSPFKLRLYPRVAFTRWTIYHDAWVGGRGRRRRLGDDF